VAHIYHDSDARLDLIQKKCIAVLGYGSQGHAHALNLRDNGCHIIVGLPDGPKSRAKAEEAGFHVMTPATATKQADIIMLLIPDEAHHEVFKRDILPGLSAGNMLLTAHGFSLHYGQIVPPENIDVAMVAPNGAGPILRRLFLEGLCTPALFAVHQDATGEAEALALSYARGIGCTRAGVLRTTIAEETETDLFAEQAVLCGGLTSLVRAGFETLIEAGYQPEIAYISCLHEVKLIVDLLYQGGIHSMHKAISNTAEYGDYVSGPRVINRQAREGMRAILHDIQNGTFAKNWILENQNGCPTFNAMRHQDAQHPIEQVGREVRAMMPLLNPDSSKT